MLRKVWSCGLPAQRELLQQQRYRRQFLREDGTQRALVLFAIAFGYAAATRNDFAFLDGRPGLQVIALASRFLLVVVSSAAFLLIRRASWPRQQDRVFYAALAATATHRVRGMQKLGLETVAELIELLRLTDEHGLPSH